MRCNGLDRLEGSQTGLLILFVGELFLETIDRSVDVLSAF